MKLKIAIQVILGLVMPWALSKLVGEDITSIILVSTPILGLTHELIHLLLIKLLRLEYRFFINGLYVGFKAIFQSVNQFIVTAIAPQIITILLALMYMITLNRYLVPLAILHIAISSEDIIKVIKYLFQLP